MNHRTPQGGRDPSIQTGFCSDLSILFTNGEAQNNSFFLTVCCLAVHSLCTSSEAQEFHTFTNKEGQAIEKPLLIPFPWRQVWSRSFVATDGASNWPESKMTQNRARSTDTLLSVVGMVASQESQTKECLCYVFGLTRNKLRSFHSNECARSCRSGY